MDRAITTPAPAPSPFRQPRAVWAVAFACVISFMGIGLVDPIRPELEPYELTAERPADLRTRSA
jgi:hypothetical protein